MFGIPIRDTSPASENQEAEHANPPTPTASGEISLGSATPEFPAALTMQQSPYTAWMDNWPGYLIMTDEATAPLHPCNVRCETCFLYGHPWDVHDPNIACWLPAGHDDGVGVHICRNCWLIQRAEAGLKLDEEAQLLELARRCVALITVHPADDLEWCNTLYTNRRGGYGRGLISPAVSDETILDSPAPPVNEINSSTPVTTYGEGSAHKG